MKMTALTVTRQTSFVLPRFQGANPTNTQVCRELLLTLATAEDKAIREKVLNLAIDILTLEFNPAAIPAMMGLQLTQKGLLTGPLAKRFETLPLEDSVELCEDVVLDRAQQEPNPVLKERAEELVPSIQARRVGRKIAAKRKS